LGCSVPGLTPGTGVLCPYWEIRALLN
jgi:hypothetical protein